MEEQKEVECKSMLAEKGDLWKFFVDGQIARLEGYLISTHKTMVDVKINGHKAIRAMHSEKTIKMGECETARNTGDERAALLHEGRAEGLERAISLILREENTPIQPKDSPAKEVESNVLLAERNTKLLVLVNKAEDLICEMISLETPRHVKEGTKKFFMSLEEYRRNLLS